MMVRYPRSSCVLGAAPFPCRTAAFRTRQLPQLTCRAPLRPAPACVALPHALPEGTRAGESVRASCRRAPGADVARAQPGAGSPQRFWLFKEAEAFTNSWPVETKRQNRCGEPARAVFRRAQELRRAAAQSSAQQLRRLLLRCCRLLVLHGRCSMSRFHPYGEQPTEPSSRGMAFSGFRAFATPGLVRPLPAGSPPVARMRPPLPPGPPPGMFTQDGQSAASFRDRIAGAQHAVITAGLGVGAARPAVMNQAGARLPPGRLPGARPLPLGPPPGIFKQDVQFHLLGPGPPPMRRPLGGSVAPGPLPGARPLPLGPPPGMFKMQRSLGGSVVRSVHKASLRDSLLPFLLLSLSPSLRLSFSPSLFLFLSLLSVSPSLRLSLSSLPFFRVSLSPSLPLSLSSSLPLSLSPSFPLSLFPSLPVSLSPSLPLSLSPSLPLSLSPSLLLCLYSSLPRCPSFHLRTH